MTSGGWIVLITSVGSIVALFSWCLYQVLTSSGRSDDLPSEGDDTLDS